MADLDLSFVDTGRRLEIEAVDGGRGLSSLSVDPHSLVESVADIGDDEEVPIVFTSVDDVEERIEDVQTIDTYLDYARTAFRQRGLTYPFCQSGAGDSLQVVRGGEQHAAMVAGLARVVRLGNPAAAAFEKRAFRALHRHIGGWAVGVGSPRENQGMGERAAVTAFRELLHPWEQGSQLPATFSPNGDRGADGFVVLGRAWAGPLLFFQAKNTNYHMRGHAEEFSRIPEISFDWFGRRYNQGRQIVRVLALNTVLTIEQKSRIFEAAGEHAGMHVLDAVDILCAELCDPAHELLRGSCIVF